MTTQTSERTGLTRREILKRGAIVGGALAWVTPAVQVVGMERARAATVSPGCFRYCLKWEADNNEKILDEFLEETFHCDEGDDPQRQTVLWTSNWIPLGGGNDDEETSQVSSSEEELTETDDSLSETDEPAEEELTETDDSLGESEEPAEEETNEEAPQEEESDDSDSPGNSGNAPAAGNNSQDSEEEQSDTDALTADTSSTTTTTTTTTLAATDESDDSSLLESEAESSTQNEGQGQGNGNQGNCLTCEPDAFNTVSGIQDVADDLIVYGDPVTGFWVSYPDSCSLANVDGLAAAAKSGGPGGGTCTPETATLEEEEDCVEGRKRVFIPNHDPLHDISHIELILDCCED